MHTGLMTEESWHTRDLVELENQYGAHNYNPLDVVIERAQGVWVYDIEGNRYLDCLAAYSAVNQGHCHPEILRAMIEQARNVTLTSRAFRNDQLPLFYQELHELTGYDMALPMNTGAEAVETAIKTARKWGYKVKGIPQDKAEVIVCFNNFHGRTITEVSFSTNIQYRDGFGPFTPGFKAIPFGDAQALEDAITPHTCAFLVEPIQGEAGIILPPQGYLKRAAEICRENRVLLLADEIQSGFGRTGKLFAYMHEGIKPDVLILGKALSGGFYPVSAVLSSWEIMRLFEPGDHGSTFGGNPLGCAVARAALRVLTKRSWSTLRRVGSLLPGLAADPPKSRSEGSARQRTMDRIELLSPARPYCEALMEEQILCKETHDRVLRISPPLVITRDEIDWAFERIRRVIENPSARWLCG